MAKDMKDFKKVDAPMDVINEIKDVIVVSEKKEPQEAELLVTFDRWFSTLGKPDHWKSGMNAFANTTGKKPLTVWNEIFKNY